MIHLLGLALFSGVLGGSMTLKHFKKKRSVARVPAVKTQQHPQALPSADKPVEKNAEQIATEEAAELDRHLLYSGSALAMATVGSLYFAPLRIASLVPLAISSQSSVTEAIKRAKNREINIVYLDVFAVFMGVGTGVFMLSALTQTLYLGSNKLLLKSKNHTRKRLSEIFVAKNQNVWVLRDEVEVATPLEFVQIGDRIVLNTGEIVPVDGVIVSGMATVDQHMLTGEAQPEEKTVGGLVFATTLLIAGRIIVEVKEAGGNTIASNIAKALDNTESYIADLQTKGEVEANKTFWPTMTAGGIATVIRGSLVSGGVALSANFSEVMRLGQPMMVLNYLRIASDQSILVKDGRSLEQMEKVDTVVFDKTGTLTQEQPHVARILAFGEHNEDDILYFAAAAEYRQSHPIARAILETAKARGIELPGIDDSKYHIGFGLSVTVNHRRIQVGSRRFMENESVTMNEAIPSIEADAHRHANSLLFVAVDGQLCGLIELAPTLRPESAEVIANLKKRGIRVVILSGDHEEPVRKLAEALQVDDYIAQALPEDKASLVERMQKEGRHVCFVGDGINDSIALKKAAVSISVREGSDIARESAQVVLLGGNLMQLIDLLDLAHELKRQHKIGVRIGTIPSLFSMGGVIFLGFGMSQIMLLYTLSAVGGIANAMLPLLQDRRTTQTLPTPEPKKLK
jgi:heavy metal translocating P-type ATPase